MKPLQIIASTVCTVEVRVNLKILELIHLAHWEKYFEKNN